VLDHPKKAHRTRSDETDRYNDGWFNRQEWEERRDFTETPRRMSAIDGEHYRRHGST
jgi:hypothetical protein